MRSCRACAAVVLCATVAPLALLPPLASVAGCDRAPQRGASPPATSPASRPAPSDEFLVQLAALRHLAGEQPLAADRSAFAAYLVRGASAPDLAEALSESLRGQATPPVVGALDTYRRKGRTIDRATGKPVKVFRVRRVDVEPAAGGAAGRAVVSWDAGRLAGATYEYRLRKESVGWVVADRVEASHLAPEPEDAPASQ